MNKLWRFFVKPGTYKSTIIYCILRNLLREGSHVLVAQSNDDGDDGDDDDELDLPLRHIPLLLTVLAADSKQGGALV